MVTKLSSSLYCPVFLKALIIIVIQHLLTQIILRYTGKSKVVRISIICMYVNINVLPDLLCYYFLLLLYVDFISFFNVIELYQFPIIIIVIIIYLFILVCNELRVFRSRYLLLVVSLTDTSNLSYIYF